MPNYGQWLLNIGGVDCNIYTGPDGQDGHLVEGNPADGPRHTVQFLCDWQDRNDLKAGLLGTVDYRGGTISRTPPFQYPINARDLAPFADGQQGMFGVSRVVCTAVPETRGIKWAADASGEITGLAGWGYFTYAALTAEFTAPPWLVRPLGPNGTGFGDLVNQTYCTSELRVSGEVFSPPTGAFLWKEGTFAHRAIDGANVGLLRPRYELSVTRVRMPMVPVRTLDNMIGTANETTIQIGANAVSPEAALFMGYNPKPRSDPYNAGIIYDIEMLWLVNGFIVERNADGSWNWLVDPHGDWSEFASLDAQENFVRPFQLAEHNDLFSDVIS